MRSAAVELERTDHPVRTPLSSKPPPSSPKLQILDRTPQLGWQLGIKVLIISLLTCLPACRYSGMNPRCGRVPMGYGFYVGDHSRICYRLGELPCSIAKPLTGW